MFRKEQSYNQIEVIKDLDPQVNKDMATTRRTKVTERKVGKTKIRKTVTVSVSKPTKKKRKKR